MNFQQIVLSMAFVLLALGLVNTITGYVIGPSLGISAEPLIMPLYTNDTSGWCNCTDCSDCTAALNDNENCTIGVKLTQNITGISGTCIDNPANFTNKTFNCQEHSMTGDLTGAAINLSDGKHFNTIKNCTIYNFSYAIIFNNASWSNFFNNSINNNINGVLTENNAGVITISYNNFTNNSAYDIIVSNNSIWTGGTSNLFNLSNVGILIYNSTEHTFTGNTFYDMGSVAVNVSDSNYSHIINSEIINSSGNGIIFENGENNYINNVTATNVDIDTFVFKNQIDIRTVNLTAKNGLGSGIVIENTTLLGSTVPPGLFFYLENNTYGVRLIENPALINITNCNITKNKVGVWANTSALNVHYNNLWNNTNFSVQNVNASMNVNAASNWWNMTTPTTGATPPKNVSLNVTFGDVLKIPVMIDTPVYIASPLNGSDQNANITLNVFTNRNATCSWGGGVSLNGSGTNHTQTDTAVNGTRTYNFSCTMSDSAETYYNSTTVYVDTIAPSVTGIKIISLNDTVISIAWNTTGDNTTGKIYYGTSTPSSYVNDTNFVTQHEKQVTGLAGATKYYFKVMALDKVNNTATTSTYYFITENRTSFSIQPGNNTTISSLRPNVMIYIQANNTVPVPGNPLYISEMQINPAAQVGVTEISFLNITVDSSLYTVLKWAYLNISYNESTVNAASINESTLKLYKYTGGGWSEFTGLNGGVNTTANYVWANVTGFSYFAVGGTLNASANCTSDIQCTSGHCLPDYDGVGAWCGAVTNCAHNGVITSVVGDKLCDGTVSTRCEGLIWSRSNCSLGCDSATGLCITSTSSPSGGSPGSGAPPGGAGATIGANFATMNASVPSVFEITNNSFDVTKITIDVNKTITGGSSVTLKQFFAKPSGLTALNNTYAYLSISAQNIPYVYLKNVTIGFAVNKSWLTSKNIDENSVVLQHYVTNWTSLPTQKIGSDSNKVKYSAVTPTFSYFAITGFAAGGEPVITPPPAAYCGDGTCGSDESCSGCESDCGVCTQQAFCGNDICELGENPELCPADCFDEEQQPTATTGIPSLIIIGGIAGALIAITAVFWFVIRPRMYHQGGVPMREGLPQGGYQPGTIYIPPSQMSSVQPQQQVIESYIQRQIQRGVSDIQTRNALTKAGWTEEQIIAAFRRLGRK